MLCPNQFQEIGKSACVPEERLLGDLRRSVPQNRQVHLHIIECNSPAVKPSRFPVVLQGDADHLSFWDGKMQ